MAIWFQTIDLVRLAEFNSNTLDAHVGIEFTAIGADWLSARMPVDHRTHQPFGLLHGGASAVLAESLGSVGANMCVDPAKFRCVGQAIHVSHIKSVRTGLVTGTARPVHIGGRSQVWQIEIRDPDGGLVSLSSLTMAVLERR